MEVNKEQAERCRDIGAQALKSKDLPKAVKMFQKSLKLYPLPGVEALLGQASSLLNTASQPSAGVNNQAPADTQPPSSPPESTSLGADGRTYTDDQVKIVNRVLQSQKGGRGAHYRVLDVSETCDENALKKAYRKLSLKVHPDKNSAPHADEAFKAVGLAYATLSDKQKRHIYDRYGEEDPDNRGGGMRRGGMHPGQEVSPEDVFNMFFGGGMPGGMHAGGAGFRVYTSGFGPGVHVHNFGARQRQRQRQAQQEQQANPFAAFMQLLPLLLILLSAFFQYDRSPAYSGSMPGEGQYFSLTTRLAAVRDIPFFVDDKFLRTFSRNRYQLGQVETMVERAYEQFLVEECDKQEKYKKQLVVAAQHVEDTEERSRRIQKAAQFELSRCKELRSIFPNRRR